MKSSVSIPDLPLAKSFHPLGLAFLSWEPAGDHAKKEQDSSRETRLFLGKRIPENDRAAIQRYGAWVKNTVREKIAPSLPALAAVQEIRAKNREQATKNAPAWFRKLAGH